MFAVTPVSVSGGGESWMSSREFLDAVIIILVCVCVLLAGACLLLVGQHLLSHRHRTHYTLLHSHHHQQPAAVAAGCKEASEATRLLNSL
jgi:hypothetical protein